MKIIDLLDDKSIRLNAEVHNKKEALDTLVDLMDASGKLNDIETYLQRGLRKRGRRFDRNRRRNCHSSL